MEIFIPERDSETVLALITALGGLGIRGRDASYLASMLPDASTDPCIRANYRDEFRYMVAPDKRDAAARLVGLADW